MTANLKKNENQKKSAYSKLNKVITKKSIVYIVEK